MYAEIEYDVSKWYLSQVHSGVSKIATDKDAKADRESKMTPHQRLIEFMAQNGVLEKSAPLQLIYNEIIKRGLSHDHEIALRFVEQWTDYRQMIYQSNRELIRDKEGLVEGFYDKFIGSLTFSDALNNPLYRNSLYPPEYDTLITGSPLVPNRKRPREVIAEQDLSKDDPEVKKYVRLLFNQAMSRAHVNEMEYFIRTKMDDYAVRCVNALMETRAKITTLAEEKKDEDTLITQLKNTITRTETHWKEAFSGADPNDQETKLALFKARDDADKLAAGNLETLVKNEKATLYLNDYETQIAMDGAKESIQSVCDTLQACRILLQDIKAPILVDWRKPKEKKQKTADTEAEWLLTTQERVEKKLLEVAVFVPDFAADRERARKSALMLDYANHLQKFDFSTPQSLIASINKVDITATYVNWILEYEAKSRANAQTVISSVRKQTATICDQASARITSIRARYEEQVELARKSKQSFEAELQIGIIGSWKSTTPVLPKDRGALARLFTLPEIAKTVSPASSGAYKDYTSLTLRGETLSQLETSVQSILLGLASVELVQ